MGERRRVLGSQPIGWLNIITQPLLIVVTHHTLIIITQSLLIVVTQHTLIIVTHNYNQTYRQKGCNVMSSINKNWPNPWRFSWNGRARIVAFSVPQSSRATTASGCCETGSCNP